MATRTPRELAVMITGMRAGTLRQHPDGSLSFSYDRSYDGPPLSLCMPISNETFGDGLVRPYLTGLLPEDRRVRKEIAREHGISANNPYALVSVMGLDLPGAVQICDEADASDYVVRAPAYVAISEEDIAGRLREMSGPSASSWLSAREHWSLGGQQSKIALAVFGGRWHSCEGSAATTHIVKPGIAHLRCHALNEHFCLELARACGIPAAKSEYVDFCGIPAVVVERFDRVVLAPFDVERIHQEDLCQALAVLPDRKYADEGGPSARDVIGLLGRFEDAQDNKLAFVSQLLFNYLIGATDAHAKNYSVLLRKDGSPLLSPMYDVASALAYDHNGRDVRLAMGIGGENRLGRVSEPDLVRFADMAELDVGLVLDIAHGLASEIPPMARDLAGRMGKHDDGAELMARLVPGIEASCEAASRMLRRTTIASDMEQARRQADALDRRGTRQAPRWVR